MPLFFDLVQHFQTIAVNQQVLTDVEADLLNGKLPCPNQNAFRLNLCQAHFSNSNVLPVGDAFDGA